MRAANTAIKLHQIEVKLNEEKPALRLRDKEEQLKGRK